METTDSNRFRRTSIRNPIWDYRKNAYYFVTICTKQKEKYFGEIDNGKMILSHQGIIANVLWFEIKNHFEFIDLLAFVVMPNHIHCIIAIANPAFEAERINNISNQILEEGRTIAETRFQNIGEHSISSIIGSYKSAVSKHLNRLSLPFAWQARFLDYIIQDQISFEKIKNYIINNPKSWKEDKFFKL